MKKLFSVLTLAASICASPVYAWGASKNSSAASIAVIDYNALLGNSDAAQKLEKEIETLRAKIQAEINKDEEALRAKEQKIDKLKLSPAAFEQKRKELVDALQKLQERVSKKSKALYQAVQEAKQKLHKEISTLVQEHAKSQNIPIVAPKEMFIYVGEDVKDLTSALLELLNKKLPKVELNVSTLGN